MAKTIVMPFGNGKHSRYAVNLKPAIKGSSSSSTKLASDCCGHETGLKRYCKKCSEHTAWKTTNKLFEFDGETHIFEAKKFDDMLSSIENTDIEVKAVLQNEPQEAELLFEKAYFLTPVKDSEAELAELKEIIGDKVLLVEFNEWNSSYQALLKLSNGVVVLKRLAESDLLNELPQVEAQVNAQVVELKQKILQKKQQESADIMDYRNKRAELEEKFYEAILSNQDVQEVVQEAVELKETDGLDELKALAED